jgi:F420 biosynthesis protein FbiB-like protein
MPEDWLRSRRSIRKFRQDTVPEHLLREIIETAAYAPSAHGLQPWRFVVVNGLKARKALGAALTGQMRSDMAAENAPEAEIRQRVERSAARLQSAPKIILLCRDSEAVRAPLPQEVQMGMQSVAMAGLQLMLVAHARGLGSVWICWPLYAQQATRQALNLPANWQPEGMIFLGYAAETPAEKRLKALNDLILFLNDETE